MIVKVYKEITVNVSSDEIKQARKQHGAFLNNGIMNDDVNVAYVLANNKALELIAKQSKQQVSTHTSIDDQVDFKIQSINEAQELIEAGISKLTGAQAGD